MWHRFGWIVAALLCGAPGTTSWAADPAVDTDLVVLVADPHVFPDKIRRANGFEADTLANFTNMVHAVTALAPRPAAVLFLGDLVEQPSLDAYRLFRKLLAPLDQAGIPYYPVLGNHDQAAAFFEVFPEWRAKTRATGSLAYRVSFPSFDVLTLETTDPANHGGYYGKIAPELREWLQAELRKMPAKPVFVAGHHDVDFGRDYPGLAKEPNLQGWLNGHWHRYVQKQSPEGVRIFWLPSLGFMDGGENPVTGYLLLRPDGNQYRLTLIANERTALIPRLAP